MLSLAEHRSPIDFSHMSQGDVNAVLAGAQTLRRAALAGETQPLLRGKNFALLSETDNADAALFKRAAVELGAHVAQIRPSLSELSTPKDVQHTARMLGRLYDALECQGLPASLVRQVGAGAGVPVFDGMALPGHLTARLAEQLGGDGTPDDKRRYVLQAVLLGTLG